MNENEALILEFQLADSGESSPTEFRYIFAAIDEMTRSLVASQMAAFVDSADLGSRAREEIYLSMFRSRYNIAVPVDVVSVRRQSPWAIVVQLVAAPLLWVLHKMLGPVIVETWGESQLRENFRRFLKEGMFRDAKHQLETSALAKPQFGNLRIDDVSEGLRRGPEAPAVTVTLRRTEVLQIESSDPRTYESVSGENGN